MTLAMNVRLSAREIVELFHLHFLRVLTTGVDKRLVVVEGGCNLRFFFASPRYSEDLELDIEVVAKTTLQKNVERALQSRALRVPLTRWGVSVGDVSAPKQTETTQRWKVGLVVDDTLPLRTKIEFSRRTRKEPAAADPIDEVVARRYDLVRHVLTHYRGPEAFVQKIRALSGRPTTQARDVFDIHWLLTTAGSKLAVPSDVRHESLSLAVERVIGLSFDQYRAQVVAYLDADAAERYGARLFFEQMQDEVLRALEALAP